MSIEIITGPMYAGKTQELIKRLQQEPPCYRKVFKPTLDGRYGFNRVTTHVGDFIPAIEIPHTEPELILTHIDFSTKMIGVDEFQFFSKGLVAVAQVLSKRGLRVLLSGLDLDFKAEPFGYIQEFRAIAAKSTQLTAQCRCGALANRTQRLVHKNEQVLIGGVGEYEARCEACHVIPS